jgi:hypothetical protein
MIVSTSHKFIFCHVPKTGGRSIAFALENFRNKNLMKSTWKADRHPGMHLSAAEIKKRYPVSQNYFCFGFCRNPYDRMVSWYAALKRDQPDTYGKLTFDEFLHGMLVAEQRDLRQLKLQGFYLNDMDRVGRYENFDEECLSIFSEIGLPEIKVTHFGASDHDHWSAYYNNPHTKKLLEDKFAQDFEDFNYDKI